MSDSISKASKKGKQKTETPLTIDTVDLDHELSKTEMPTVIPREIKIIRAEEMNDIRLALAQFEGLIAKCQSEGHDWLEVGEEVLKLVNKGQLPDEKFIIYKNIKVALNGESENIAKKLKLSSHSVLFPSEKFIVR